MAEGSNELSYEVLKAVQARLGNIEHKFGEVESRLVQMVDRIGLTKHSAE